MFNLDTLTFSIAAQTLAFAIPGEYGYDNVYYRLQSQTFLTFQVAGCKDAHVALFDSRDTDDAYEIVIGQTDNQYTSIRTMKLEVCWSYLSFKWF